MYLIVGLGNPGKKYENTRHNIGFLIVDEIAKRSNLEFRKKTALQAEVAEGTIGENRVLLCKPQTFMNGSGKSVKEILSKYPVKEQTIIVIYDDADLKFGDVRLKAGGSSAGHNGMESILEVFPRGTGIHRVRVGIGRPSHTDIQLEDFVLQKWTDQETESLDEMMAAAIKLVTEFIES